jgi:hypothetical protein
MFDQDGNPIVEGTTVEEEEGKELSPEESGEEELKEGDEGYVAPEPEKEPTIKELMELVKNQGTQIDKANKRTQYLQRKLTRGHAPEKLEPPKAKPDESEFETNAEYVEALTDWKVDQREHSKAEKMTERQSKEREEDFFSVIDSGAEKYKDFNEVARKTPDDGGPTINENMLEAMMDSENVVDIAYYLGQNVEESVRISNLSPIGTAREIGKIEAMFSGGGKKILPQKTKTKTVTPSKPIEGKTATDVDLNDLSMDDFMKTRNAADGVG